MTTAGQLFALLQGNAQVAGMVKVTLRNDSPNRSCYAAGQPRDQLLSDRFSAAVNIVPIAQNDDLL